MGFKSKINPSELGQMTQKEYQKVIQKEINRAEKFGSTEIMVFSDFEFACGTVATLMIIGKLSGNLAKFYKKAKQERKKENDFAKGTCYFETTEKEGTKLHIALNDGKGKPTKMQKNGKALFKKLGIKPNIFKGELPAELLADTNAQLNESEEAQIAQTAEEGNEDKSLARVAKQYQKLHQKVAQQLIPILKSGQGLEDAHFELAKKAYTAAKSFLDKYEEAKPKAQERFADLQVKVGKEQDKLKKIAAKVKKELSNKAQVHGSAEDVAALLSEVEDTLAEMKPKFEAAFQWLDQLSTK